MCSEKTIYNYIDSNLLSVKNLDLPRKVAYRKRKLSSVSFKVDKSCRNKSNPDIPIVQMDSVEGTKGGKVLLTIHFTVPQFMLAFIRDANTSRSVRDVFNELYTKLGSEIFSLLFPVILTDNGSEFSDPSSIEFDSYGNRRTYIFYCDPSSPYQKGAIENNHEFIRRIVPKGKSFNNYSQNDISNMMNHINSYGRNKLNNKSPYSLFSLLYGQGVLDILRANLIIPSDICLSPGLLK